MRRELRELRRLTHSIEAALSVKELHEKRIRFLLDLGTTEALVEAEKIKNIVSSLRIEESIKKAGELESCYMAAIGELPRIDRTVIIEGYINGKAYWKIGREIGYSERSIQAKVDAAIGKLAKIL